MQSRQQPIRFPCRDLVRQGKAQFVYHVLLQGENNGIYLRGGSAAKLDYPLNEASVSHLAQVILDIQNTYLKDTQVHAITASFLIKMLIWPAGTPPWITTG